MEGYESVRFNLRRGSFQVPFMLIGTVVAITIGLLLAGAPWWLVSLVVVAYAAVYLSVSEFWFRRLNYAIVRGELLEVSKHSWGLFFGFGLLFPVRIRTQIDLSLIRAIKPKGGLVVIEYRGFDNGKGPILFDKKLRLLLVDTPAFLKEVKRRAPALLLG